MSFIIVVAHVETVVGVVRVLALTVVERSSFSYSGPCFSCRPCIVPSDLGVVPGSWRPFLVVGILMRCLLVCKEWWLRQPKLSSTLPIGCHVWCYRERRANSTVGGFGKVVYWGIIFLHGFLFDSHRWRYLLMFFFLEGRP